MPHNRLIKWVEVHGFVGEILNWIKAWVMDKKQRISIKRVRSVCGAVSCGVPQGIVLGPLLFITDINNIDIQISSNIRKFADDNKNGRIINSEDSIALQKT